jgi:hypothetical protein
LLKAARARANGRAFRMLELLNCCIAMPVNSRKAEIPRFLRR